MSKRLRVASTDHFVAIGQDLTMNRNKTFKCGHFDVTLWGQCWLIVLSLQMLYRTCWKIAYITGSCDGKSSVAYIIRFQVFLVSNLCCLILLFLNPISFDFEEYFVISNLIKEWYGNICWVVKWSLLVCLMVFNATFNNISVISWRSVLMVEETGGPR